MGNLLPTEYKKEIYRMYKIRLLIVFMIFVSFTGLVILIFLAPIFLSVNFEFQSLEKERAILEAETPELKVITELESKVSGINRKIQVLGQDSESKTTKVLSEIISNKTTGIKIKSISYSKKETGAIIFLRGEATTRESLVLFAKRLEDIDNFTDVNLPVSNLAKDRDLVFSITFSVI